ncbi:MAG TPA: FAD-dependent oxidoreductase [Planctomycetota bacterium]|nr:FAD-dependent oxidoreductase [Planctomycetota bacterium]
MVEPRILILGGGPAGVGAAWQLARQKKAHVTLIERGATFGGNSGSFELFGQRLDYGSHRLHPATEPRIMADVRKLLGEELLDRPRHGRIRLLGKWIHFPLKPVDLLLRLDKSFALGTLRDMAAKKLPGAPEEGDTFASVLRANLGATICEHFYFPYAVKLWGRAPEELSGIQARRRVSAGTFGKLARKVLGAVPGMKKPGAGRFFYPRRGFGAISEAYAAEAVKLGATLRTRTQLLELTRAEGGPWRASVQQVAADGNGAREELVADQVWSTIPITALAKAIVPAAPRAVLEAGERTTYRAMILVYLQIPVARFTEYDAHYFPGADTRITRLSEPKNYAALSEPRDSTVLCAELPCTVGDEAWKLTDEALGRLVADDLARAGIPLPRPPAAVATRRLGQAYPIYLNGYEAPLRELDQWALALPDLISYGRQGLFAHDNTHHALFMAYSAVECLDGMRFDREKWARFREVFQTHVVED